VRGDFPRLHLDRFQLTRAVFDLIDDQLKYARNVTAPRLEIEARGVIGDRFEISFRDWGLAADEWRYEGASPSTVFARTLGAISSGRGSGLWFAERAISLHGGKLLLRSREDPTEFVIVLPIALVENPPNS
jgi:signal transduction histidine kinase